MPSATYDEQLPSNKYVPGTWRQEATVTELKCMSGANTTWYACNMRQHKDCINADTHKMMANMDFHIGQ